MSGFSAGIATFNSCNKAGSIPHFTSHIQLHPNDYQALMWRGRAYSIIKQQENARKDFRHAMRVSVDPNKALAAVQLEWIDGNVNGAFRILQSTTDRYPQCAEAWSELGDCFLATKNSEKALPMLQNARELGKQNGETKSPWYPCCNRSIGSIYFTNGKVEEAKRYFQASVESCSTLTVGYLGLCNCAILQGNYQEAEKHFQTARRLNQVLVPHDNLEAYCKATFADESVDELVGMVKRFQMKHTQPQHGVEAFGTPQASGGGSGSGGGNRGGGSGNSSDSSGDESADMEKALQEWKIMKKRAPQIKTYGGRTYVLDKDEKFWYTRDTAGHAGAFLKVYENKGRNLVFRGSMDVKFRFMEGKHESRHDTIIKKSDMHTIK